MTNAGTSIFSLLCAGNSLGVYVPAIQLNYQLRQQNQPTDIHILENLYKDEIKARVPAIKKAFHDHFDLAKKSAKWVRDAKESLDSEKVNVLLSQWYGEKRTRFIVFTGFWIPVLEQYQKMMEPIEIKVDLLRMDAGISASYQVYKERCNVFRNIWFFSAEENKILREFTISNQRALPYSSRDQGIVLHGGGWGIGTYREAKEMLLASHHRLTMLAYAFEEIEIHERIAYCLNDPEWSPWSQDEQGSYTFPPLAMIEHGREPIFHNQDSYPLMFDVIRSAKAIVSKPGGYSLFESFAAATPFVFLEPFAEHEVVNAEFWINQGFGIWFKQWEKEHFSDRCIEKLHENLLDARKQISQGGQYNAT